MHIRRGGESKKGDIDLISLLSFLGVFWWPFYLNFGPARTFMQLGGGFYASLKGFH